MKNIQEDEITCDLLKEALEKARRSALDDMGRVYPYMGEKGTGVSEMRCAGANLGCKKRVKVIYTAPKIIIPGLEPITGYDLAGAKETIQTDGNPCVMGEMK